MSDTVLVQDNGDWVEVTLNRPDKLNAFNAEMHLALRAALDGASAKRAVLLTGAGRAFCAGQDLGERDPRDWDEPPDLGETVRTYWAPLVRQLKALELPVVCAVNGVAAGAGVSVALACDVVIAARSARFIQAFAKIGLVPDAGGTWLLPRLIGEARAKALALTAEPLSAERAEEWGLIWKVAEDDMVRDEGRALARRLAGGPTFGLGLTKRAVQAAAENDFATQLALEAELQGRAARSEDYAEGATAFLEKRPAKFTGEAP